MRLLSLAALTICLLAAVAAGGLSAQETAAGPSVTVEGTSLVVRTRDGRVLRGTELIGATLVLGFRGQRVRVRIGGIEPDPDDRTGEILLHDFRLDGPDGGPSLCEADPEGRKAGFPLAGRTDPTGLFQADPAAIEIVCTSGGQGKCVRFGYAPWRQGADGRSLAGPYNACVRLLRADYCGDGQSHTRDGTLIDIYDRLGIQSPAGDPSLAFEAAWGPGGAACVARTRIPALIDLDELARSCPRLVGRLGPEACREASADAPLLNRSR